LSGLHRDYADLREALVDGLQVFRFLADVSLLASIVASAEGFFTYDSLIDWTLTFYGNVAGSGVEQPPIWPTEAWTASSHPAFFPWSFEQCRNLRRSAIIISLWPASCRLRTSQEARVVRALAVFGLVSMVLSKTETRKRRSSSRSSSSSPSLAPAQSGLLVESGGRSSYWNRSVFE